MVIDWQRWAFSRQRWSVAGTALESSWDASGLDSGDEFSGLFHPIV